MTEQGRSDNLKWHQRWWGILILLIFAFLLVFGAALLYQVITILEVTRQYQLAAVNQNLNQVFLPEQNLTIQNVLETKDDPYWGPAEAKIVIVEFSDFQCPFCQQAFPVMQKIRQEYKDSVKLIYRDFPSLSAHPDSLNAAMAAECADDQNMFWPYHDLMFMDQNKLSISDLKQSADNLGLDPDKFNQCLDNKKYYFEVLNDIEDGSRFGISGTPTFYINGNRLEGVQSYETLKIILDQALIDKATNI